MFPGGSLFLFVALGAGNLSAYAFHLAMTRMLGPSEYGTLGALLGILLILGVPVAAIQAVVARHAARIGTDDVAGQAALVGSGLSLTFKASAMVAVAMIALSVPASEFLNVSSPVPLMLVGGLVIPSLMVSVLRGALQGAARFRPLGWTLLGYVTLRLGLGVGLAATGLGVAGAIGGILLAEVVGFGLTLVPLRRALGMRSPRLPDLGGLFREGARASLVLLAFWVVASLDVVLAKHHFPAGAAGRYAGAALAGKAVLFVATAVAMIAYPRFAEDRDGSRGVLRVSCALVAAAAAGAALVMALFPALLSFVLGPGYTADGSVAPLLALANGAFGIAAVLTYHRLALGRTRVPLLWLAIPIEAGVIALFHGSPATMAAAVLVSATLIALGMSRRGGSRSRRAVRVGELWEPSGEMDLSVITPTYNGQGVLAPNLVRLLRSLDDAGINHEVIVVSDGSTDGTVEEARPFTDRGVRLLHYEVNRGKGFALRTGLARATGRYVAYIDSDGDLEPNDLVRFLTLMRLYEADMVVGSKRHALSEVSYPLTRRILSWGYHAATRALFGIRASDTQTGIKLVRREVLAEILPRLLEKRFAFDLELMVAARRAGFRRVLEAPIQLTFRFSSTISRRAVAGMAKDTLAIWYRRFIVHQYDPEPEEAPVAAPPTLRPVPEPVARAVPVEPVAVAAGGE